MKNNKYRVRLFASLPCSAEMLVEAKTKEDAIQWALNNWAKFPWDGPDENRPSGCDVEVDSDSVKKV